MFNNDKQSSFYRWRAIVLLAIVSCVLVSCGFPHSREPRSPATVSTELRQIIDESSKACLSPHVISEMHAFTMGRGECNSEALGPPELSTLAAAAHVQNRQRAIKLAWSVNQTGTYTFEVKRQIEANFVTVGTTTDYEFVEFLLEPSTLYTYRVSIIGGPPKDTSTSTWAPFAGAPAAPTFDSPTMESEVPVVLAWNDQSSDEEEFVIEKRDQTTSFFFAELARLGSNTISYTDAAVTDGHTYIYRVYAYHSDPAKGGSANAVQTVTVGAVGPEPPLPPAFLNIEVQSPTQVKLTWGDSNEDFFELERKEGVGSFVALASLPQDVTSYIDGTLQPGTLYTYPVRAVKDGLFSDWIEASVNTAPEITLSPLGLDTFCAPGESDTFAATLQNTGGSMLLWNSVSDMWGDAIISSSPVSGNLSPGASQPITISYTCPLAGGPCNLPPTPSGGGVTFTGQGTDDYHFPIYLWVCQP